MRYAVFLILFGATCFAGDARRPVCNSRNQGQFWPEEANSNRDTARQTYQRGELEMCTLAVWRYRWKAISVNARVLAARKHPPVWSTEKLVVRR